MGWICALPIELTAAIAILDERYEGNDDTSQYTFGRIGMHNIVVVCLPAGHIGTNNAAAVAMQMKSTFPSLHSTLMVGIGGGAPTLKPTFGLVMWSSVCHMEPAAE